MSTSGTKDIQQIRKAAQAACAGKGIPENIPNPNLPGTMIVNPLFIDCVNKEVEKSAKGLNKAVSFIENRGGLKAVIDEFYDIRSQVTGTQPGQAPPQGTSSSSAFWLMIFVLIILVIVFLVVLFKNPKM